MSADRPMRINFVVPALLPSRSSAGTVVIVECANRLALAGHSVAIVSMGVAQRPDWTPLHARVVEHRASVTALARALVAGLAAEARRTAGRGGAAAVRARVTDLVRGLAIEADSDPIRRGAEFDRLRRVMPDADVTIATAWTTVAPVAVYGRGTRAHFIQNYEAWFLDGFEDRALALAEAGLALRLPMHRASDVGWLADLLRERHGIEGPIIPGGVDMATFRPGAPRPPAPFTVLTYGGRGLPWKGFADAAEAIRLARREIPELRWRVFGGASLPAANDVAAYEDEGVRSGPELCRLYAEAHVTLCPSWFEAFPFPPLEAMASGSPVIATPRGCSDIGIDGENVVLVPPRDPETMAEALVALARDEPRRARLAGGGLATAERHGWPAAAASFEDWLRDIAGRPPPAAPGGEVLTLESALEEGWFERPA